MRSAGLPAGSPKGLRYMEGPASAPPSSVGICGSRGASASPLTHIFSYGERQAAFVVAGRHLVPAAFERIRRVPHDDGSTGEIQHGDVVQVVAHGHDVGAVDAAGCHE